MNPELLLHGNNPRHRYTTSLARCESEVQEAQRLRYKVFAEEMGAQLPSAPEGLDRDIFDKYCDHLLVRDNTDNKVVGTYRILSPQNARVVGSYYSESEFDLTRLQHLRGSMVEVGRSCVHPDHRDGATITQLWSGLANFMLTHRHEYLIGCASISMSDGGHYAASVYNRIHKLHAAPVEYQVFPRCPLPLAALNQDMDVSLPPLIKGYLRLGAYVCGAPTWDPDFNCADIFILLPLSRLSAKYSKRFL